MSSTTAQPVASEQQHAWQPLPDVGDFIHGICDQFASGSSVIDRWSERLYAETGTRLIDWVDHFELPADVTLQQRMLSLGYKESTTAGATHYTHAGVLLPRVTLTNSTSRRLFLRVESVVDFVAANSGFDHVQIEGQPNVAMRRARIDATGDIEFWIIERHGWTSDDVPAIDGDTLMKVLRHEQAFRLRQREFEYDHWGFEHAAGLISSAIENLGVDRACDLFFAAEREYWQRRNHAARVQKARQDALGLGWANHDHHTYRSSRSVFAHLIAVLERLGFHCRERFYAGREAGWGAQVLEQPNARIVIFADVDLSPEEVTADFSHEPLPPSDTLGTVGLWCRLHGEAFLQAGMHHLECQFDFDAARAQLTTAGVPSMKPFTDLPFLRQAFTRGEWWSVEECRIASLLTDGLINDEQARQFREKGALGSHLEVLERHHGYKGFNQTGINEIIRDTDPRKQ
jgi:hypothetical protein